jgi:hypothetical protein
MARLTSRVSVLRALAGPERDVAQPGNGGTPPRGDEIWQSALQQAEFYVAYAEMLELGRRSQGSAGGWERAGRSDGQWAGRATVANSYRQAAQYACLVDPDWATRLAVQAGVAYVNAGLPYGLFLLAGILDDQALLGSPAQSALVSPFQAADTAPAVQHPVQLTYLVLAAAARPELRDPLSETLEGAERRLAAHDLRPIGPQSVPLGDYLDLATFMFNDDRAARSPGSGSPARTLATRLAEMHRAQAAGLRAARRNQYLWRNGASRVNVVDLEHVAISGLALRHRPWFGELSSEITAQLDRDDPLAELPVWAMGTINESLPAVAPSVDAILRHPNRVWHAGDFPDEHAEVRRWDYEPERNYRRDDTQPESRRDSGDANPREDNSPRELERPRPEPGSPDAGPRELEGPRTAPDTPDVDNSSGDGDDGPLPRITD